MKINHVTLNTGNNTIFSDKDIDKQLYFTLNRLFSDSQGSDGAEFELGNYKYKVKTTLSGRAGVSTLLGYNPEGEMVPILTTGFSLYSYDIFDLLAHDDNYASKLDLNKVKKPKTPYIIDRLEVGAVVLFYQGIMQWSGDYSKCLGLIALKAIL